MVENVRKDKRKQKNEMLLRRITTSLSFKKLFVPIRKVCKRVTANISPGYNGVQNPLFV